MQNLGILGTMGVGLAVLDIWGTAATVLATYAMCRLWELVGREDLGGSALVLLIIVPLVAVTILTRLPLRIREVLGRERLPEASRPIVWMVVAFLASFAIGTYPAPTQERFLIAMACACLAATLAYRYLRFSMGVEIWTMGTVVMGTLVFISTESLWFALTLAALVRAVGVIIHFYRWRRAGRASMPSTG